jgi:hypothetical protein
MLRGLARRAGNHGHLPVQRCRQAGYHSDRPEHSACSLLPFYSHHSRSIPFFRRNILGIRRTMGEIDFFDLVSGSEQVEEDRLVHSSLAEFEVVPMNRRFRTRFCWYIEPGTSSRENVQDTVKQPAGVTPRSANARLRWWEVFLNDTPGIIVNFPEYHDLRFYLRGHIVLGSPRLLGSPQHTIVNKIY